MTQEETAASRMNRQLKEMVSDNRRVRFLYFVAGELWYETENKFPFPVPVSDTGNAKFLPEDKALLFMRYIRKQLERCQPDLLPVTQLPVTL